MKKVIMTLALCVGLSNAFCEYGSKINQEYVQGGYLVTYDFGQARFLSFKFPSGASIPFSLRYDFNRYELCY